MASLTHKLQTFSDGTFTVQKITNPGTTLGVVYLDYDQQWPANVVEDPKRRFHVSRPTRNRAARYVRGLPATARFKLDDYVVMTKDIQLWMHGICWAQAPGMTKDEAGRSWASIMHDSRYTTNGFGSASCADYVNNSLTENEPMRLQPMTTGGAILKIIGEGIVGGEDCWKFEAINSKGNYRQYNPKDHWWLFYKPSNSVRNEIWFNDKWTGNYIENISEPFPQYLGRAVIPIFGVEVDYNFLPKWRIRILQQGESLPSPFTG